MRIKEPFTRGQAWVDLLLNANHKDGGFHLRGNYVAVKRGQIAWSERFMAERWQWNREKVRNFLRWLEENHQILTNVPKAVPQTVPQKRQIISLIIIKNYTEYQETRPQTVPQTVPTPKNVLRMIKKKEGPASYEAKGGVRKGMQTLQSSLERFK